MSVSGWRNFYVFCLTGCYDVEESGVSGMVKCHFKLKKKKENKASVRLLSVLFFLCDAFWSEF